MKGEEVNVPDLAASLQERIAGILAEKLLLAAADTGAKQVCLAGGVAANGRLRQLVNDGAQKLGAKVYLPELKFCGDNGAMIAAQGYYQYIAGHTAGWSSTACPPCPLTTNKIVQKRKREAFPSVLYPDEDASLFAAASCFSNPFQP